MCEKYLKILCMVAVIAILSPGYNVVAQESNGPEEADSSSENIGPVGTSPPEEIEFTASVWADNWFSLYVNGRLVGQDSVPLTSIRSFNSDTITFRATYPLTIAVVTKDYIENDSGLEYIGSLFGLVRLGDNFTFFQQMGDGGFIAQIAETKSGKIVAATSADWRGLIIHKAPLNPECEKSSQPLEDCKSAIAEEPVGWQSKDFDDSNWAKATLYTPEQIGAKFGYNDINWDPSAKLIWTEDLKTDNTILWRFQVPK